MSAAIEEFGHPVYGLAGEDLPVGTVSQYGDRSVSVRYELSRVDHVEVRTSRRRLGGTRGLMLQLATIAIPLKPRLPWELSLRERNAFVSVDGTSTQFHVVEASTGQWMAAGGFRRWGVRKRYLLLTGTSGVHVEDLSLVPVTFDPGEGSAAGTTST